MLSSRATLFHKNRIFKDEVSPIQFDDGVFARDEISSFDSSGL